MSKIIAVANQKGGVGKTTTAVNLAAGLKEKGKKVIVIDLDPQANLSSYLGHVPDELPTVIDLLSAEVNDKDIDIGIAIRTNHEGLEYIPANILLSGYYDLLMPAMNRERVLESILKRDCFLKYDYIIIDCLPALGILLVNALTASNSVLIPVQSELFSLEAIQDLLQSVSKTKRKLNPQLYIEGIVLTMANNTVICREVMNTLKAEYGQLLFETTIRRAVEAPNSTVYKKSLISMKGKLGKEYSELADEILRKEAN